MINLTPCCTKLEEQCADETSASSEDESGGDDRSPRQKGHHSKAEETGKHVDRTVYPVVHEDVSRKRRGTQR